MKTSQKSISKNLKRLISLSAVFHAKISAMQEKEPESKDQGLVFFSECGKSFAWSGPGMSSWKTFQRSLIEEWEEFCPPFPKVGILQNGKLYRPLIVEHSTKGKDGGLLHIDRLWPTPLASNPTMSKERRKSRRFPDTLKDAVRLWPTPTHSKFMFPNAETFFKRALLQKNKISAYGVPLSVAVLIGDNWYKQYQKIKSSKKIPKRITESPKLNPDWVDCLMGYPKGYTIPDGNPDRTMIKISDWKNGSWEEEIPRLKERNHLISKRIRALGNAVVPQCVSALFEQIGKHIKDNYKDNS